MKETACDLFFTENQEITLLDWEHIVHSLITYGNILWIPSNLQFAPKIELDLQSELKKTFNELIEEKCIFTWELEITGSKNK